ncbi:MATE family efflux transporter [Ketobacter nezhaii]|uniref:MATE family efflux transporter n=1 Tax=Ketobacter sp. MCCC 1A13808 TaxID=2602738 RepID=UPI0018DD0EED|nr:MATE family efflux transporter [Ketobacter sp. MCCC 1A13808]
MLQTIYTKSVISFCLKLMSAAILYIVTVIVTRKLGKSESGIYFIGYSLTIISCEISRLGLDNVLLKRVGIHSGNQLWGGANSLLKTTMRMVVFPSCIVGGLIWLFSFEIAANIFSEPELSSTLSYFSLSIPFLAALTLLCIAFQGASHTFSSIILSSIMPPGILGIALLVLPIKTSEQTTIVYSFSIIFTFVVSYLGWIKAVPRGLESKSISVKTLLNESFPLLWVAVMSQGLSIGTIIILGIIEGADEVSQFVTAQRVSLIISFTLVAVNVAYAPRYAQLYSESNLSGIKSLSYSSTKFMLLLSIPIFLVLSVFPKYVMSVFGPEFAHSSHVLVILCFAQMVNVMTGSVGILLAMTNHQIVLRNAVSVTGIFSLLLVCILSYAFGLTGAAIASSLGLAAQNLFLVIIVKRNLGINTITFWK